MPLISVIIPTFKRDSSLIRAIKSIIGSNYARLEIIVVDNQSTDQTVVIAQKLGAKVFQSGPERSSQRNFGAKKSPSQYLLFLDADMTIDKNFYKKIPFALKKFSKTLAFVIPEKTEPLFM